MLRLQPFGDGRASFYTVASGLPELKAAVNTYFERYYGYSVSANEVTFVTGAKFSPLYFLFMAVGINPGDEVIIPTPYWVSYGDQVKMAEGLPFVQAKEDNHFKVTVELRSSFAQIRLKSWYQTHHLTDRDDLFS